MNNKNNETGSFDYDEYLKRIKRLNDDVESFSINQPKRSTQAPKSEPIKPTPKSQYEPTKPTPKSQYEPIKPTPKSQNEQKKSPPVKKPVNKKSVDSKNKNKKKFNSSQIYILIIIAVVVALCLIVSIFSNLNSSEEDSNDVTTEIVTDNLDEEDTSSESAEETTEEETTEVQAVTYSYETLLVNFENPLPDDYYIELVDYQDMNGNWWTVGIDIVDPLDEMIAAAANNGVYLIINSAYRSNEAQLKLYTTTLEDYEADGYTSEEAEDLAQQYVADPGTSEHETGIAIDLGYTNSTTWTACYTWLDENSYKYGFIVRYPSGKSDITQISYEPWHFRYVGVEIATEMYELDLCLEEYYELKGW